MDEQALNQCSAILCNSLNISIISPHLSQHQLLTGDESQTLNNPCSTDDEKIQHLICILPTKGDNWLDKFVKCLNETSEGNGHSKIVKELERAKKRLENTTKEESSMESDNTIIITKESYNKGLLNKVEEDCSSISINTEAATIYKPQPGNIIKQGSLPAEPRRPQLTADQLKKQFNQHFCDKAVEEKKHIDDIKKSKYEVLIQTVNDNEFYAAMLQFDHYKATRYIGYDPVCHSLSHYHVGEWDNIPVVIIKTAMGSNGVNSCWYETKKALYFMPHLKYIFSVGVCGGVAAKGVNMGDVIVSKHICGYGDLKVTPSGRINRSVQNLCTETSAYQCFAQPNITPPRDIVVKRGVIMSGPWLIADAKTQCDLLKISPDAIAFEMEGANIVQACGQTRVECLVVKGVSDFADENKTDDWQPQAAMNAAKYLKKVINEANSLLEVKSSGGRSRLQSM